MGYNLVERKELPFEVEEGMGLVEFLRRLSRKEALPQEFQVEGFDSLLDEAQDHVQVATFIRNLLAERSDYLGMLNPAIYIAVDASLEEDGHPRMYLRSGKVIELPTVFGNRLERHRRYWFRAGFNITRGGTNLSG